ncbi:ribonucleotide-diphosphate reductase subunit beta [Bacillus sonorensis]|uniref:ribonucleotide-diphosphate reductase subunit beta n=1 Tax=Bacillus sonorensis TaxID=119858 RepID=UPI002DBE6551|nr:ribonucleotide-diphosphate reductase subunit beta [Bacillus sonorensis]MEC1440604.1 ribonucleotide-diphosphate reductase subunit beta [Bacillus sonorensis]
MDIKKRKIYDTEAPNKSTGIVNGESSNILNWDDIAYPFARRFYKAMMKNFWRPEEIDMSADRMQFPTLPEAEQDTFKKIIGLLAFLDSVQSDYTMRVADFITDSSLNATMITLSQQEVIHNESYTYTLSSLVNSDEQHKIFNYWRTDKVLRKRNDFLAKGYEEFTDNPSLKTLLRSVVYDVILEGLFFYSGFAFFYNLARNQKMLATAKMINFINRDEQQHVGLFCNIYKQILSENKQIDREEMEKFTIETFRRAAEYEMAWADYIIGNRIEGISVKDVHSYVKFIANKRVRELGYGNERVFPGYTQSPLKWIKVYEDNSLGKADFFETKVSSYNKVSKNNGFDQL